MQDWNQPGRYHAGKLHLRALPADRRRVVFPGDSITGGWKLVQSFPGRPCVNRGISGQTTPQMPARMFADVINLKPAAMIILAGTNDIARNTGPMTLEQIGQNIQAMTEPAQAHGIEVVLCSLLPVSGYTQRKQTDRRPPAGILRLNAWIKEYAVKAGAVCAGYFSVSVHEKGMLREGIPGDGLHRNAKGYDLMAPVAQAAIERALKQGK